MLYRIGEMSAVSSDKSDIISRLTLQNDTILVEFWEGEAITLCSSQKEFAQYSTLIASCPPFIDKLHKDVLREIQKNYTHPLKAEFPEILFILFQSISDEYDLELRLEQDGRGSVWTTHGRLFFWETFEEGITLLRKHKMQVA